MNVVIALIGACLICNLPLLVLKKNCQILFALFTLSSMALTVITIMFYPTAFPAYLASLERSSIVFEMNAFDILWRLFLSILKHPTRTLPASQTFHILWGLNWCSLLLDLRMHETERGTTATFIAFTVLGGYCLGFPAHQLLLVLIAAIGLLSFHEKK